MEIRIQPLDTLFFRDGKPFEKEEETWADGMMIPNPSVVYGVLRTAFATANNISFKDLAEGVKLHKEEFNITNIYYRVEDDYLMPLPLDLVEYEKEKNITFAEEEKKRYEVKPLALKSLAATKIVATERKEITHFLLPKSQERVDGLENGFIVTTELAKYLNNELENTLAYKLSDYIQPESKIGIGREDATKVSEEGNLFRVDMRRSDTFQIGVSIENKSKFTQYAELVKMGGEGKIVNLFHTRIPMRVIRRNVNFKNNRFKIYFSTPAILKDGKPNLSELGLNEENIQLITAYVGKPLHIGGFDMYRERPKPMYKAIPAGSVFYYESKEGVSLLNDHQGTSLSDELSEQGFGICYFGTWNMST